VLDDGCRRDIDVVLLQRAGSASGLAAHGKRLHDILGPARSLLASQPFDDSRGVHDLLMQSERVKVVSVPPYTSGGLLETDDQILWKICEVSVCVGDFVCLCLPQLRD